jgi:hypothetical protein
MFSFGSIGQEGDTNTTNAFSFAQTVPALRSDTKCIRGKTNDIGPSSREVFG